MARQTIKLGELVKSAWQKVNANFEELYNTIANKQDKEAGKGLSTNDYTSADKTKLSNIAAGAQVNVIETVKVNGTALTPSGKAVNIDLSGKVDKVTGKGLSTNDFTDAYKNKIDSAASVTKSTFAANGWGSADSNGYYNMSIAAAGKYPVKVMRNESGTYTEALVQTAVSGSNVVITSEEAFEGYVILI
jgi:hypothetical protein|nr:MAG TPA: Head fiber protein [Caudoviricetes sp.]